MGRRPASEPALRKVYRLSMWEFCIIGNNKLNGQNLVIKGHEDNRLMILLDSFDLSIQTQLTRIDVEYTNLENLKAFGLLQNLIEAFFRYNQIQDISAIGNCK